MKMMPKTIHWCWLSGDPIPKLLKRYMRSWGRVMPDWKVKCWTQENFDVQRIPWVAQAVAQRKWAYAADYIRLYALYHEGGVYLDSDVLVVKSFEPLCKHDFFTSIETNCEFYEGIKDLDADGHPLDLSKPVKSLGLQAAIMGAKPGNAYVRDCMKWYETHDFVNPDGTFNMVVMPAVIALEAVKYGFRYEDKEQELDGGVHIFDSSVFAGAGCYPDDKMYAIHWCEGSWRDRSLGWRIMKVLKRPIPRFMRRFIRRFIH